VDATNQSVTAATSAPSKGPQSVDCVALSKERANSVSDYLVMKGVNRNQLTSKGFVTHYVANNATQQARAQNRRVELVPDEEQ
jgi:outer membrane protein OmpA-like peptidoglycan-associated protein